MSEKYDVAVVGAGPAGSAAAWRAATSGARVICLDKAEFPRDKPCGDGITPRAVSLVRSMGLSKEIEKFHRIDGIRIYSPSPWQAKWPQRPGVPRTGYVARRTDFDLMLLNHAASSGTELRQGCKVVAPIVDGGKVSGLVVADGSGAERVVRADVVIAADGAYSAVKRALAPKSSINGYVAVAIRAEMDARRPDDHYFEIHTGVRHNGVQLPGYGWVFPVGEGRVNIGVGYLTSYKQWQEVNAATLMDELLASLPAAWELPTVAELRRTKALRAWRLPTGFNTWPPQLPGVMFAGDAAGMIKPSNGAGISKAIQSGQIAGQCAVDALAGGDPKDLSDYGAQLSRLWGNQYRMGRAVHRLIGYPSVIGTAYRLMDNRIARQAAVRFLYGGDGKTYDTASAD